MKHQATHKSATHKSATRKTRKPSKWNKAVKEASHQTGASLKDKRTMLLAKKLYKSMKH